MRNPGPLAGLLIGVLLIAFILAAGCTQSNSSSLQPQSSNLTSNPVQGGLNTYSNYNVSFNYPVGMAIAESGFKDNDANFDSGGVIVKNQSDYIVVLWEKSMGQSINLDEVYLTEFEKMKSDPNITNVSIGNIQTVTHLGNTISTVAITYTEAHQQYNSQVAWWYCPESNRVFSIDVRTQQDLTHAKNMLMTYLDSFKCT